MTQPSFCGGTSSQRCQLDSTGDQQHASSTHATTAIRLRSPLERKAMLYPYATGKRTTHGSRKPPQRSAWRTAATHTASRSRPRRGNVSARIEGEKRRKGRKEANIHRNHAGAQIGCWFQAMAIAHSRTDLPACRAATAAVPASETLAMALVVAWLDIWSPCSCACSGSCSCACSDVDRRCHLCMYPCRASVSGCGRCP